jgi:hypothetical protein
LIVIPINYYIMVLISFFQWRTKLISYCLSELTSFFLFFDCLQGVGMEN